MKLRNIAEFGVYHIGQVVEVPDGTPYDSRYFEEVKEDVKASKGGDK